MTNGVMKGEVDMPKAVMIGGMVVLAAANAFAGVGSTVAGKAVAKAVERQVTRKIAAEAVVGVAKSAVERSMSTALVGAVAERAGASSLASIGAKQAMGIGAGAGLAVALPVAAHEIAAGKREESKAKADATLWISETVAKIIPEHPELVGEVLEKINGGGDVLKNGTELISTAGMIFLDIVLALILLYGVGALKKVVGIIRVRTNKN